MGKLNYQSRVYHIRGITPILGGLPASRDIYTQYIASKNPQGDGDQEIIDHLREEKGITVFARDSRENICLLSRHIRGFFKEALSALKAQCDIGRVKNKIDTLLFVEPALIPLMRNGRTITDEDSMLERPLRADTLMGPRIALQSSEIIEDPWEFDMEISLFPNNGTSRKESLSWEAIETALDYGAFHGIGQWRNADYGKFIWKKVEE